MKKRTRNLLIVLAIVLAAILFPRLCAPGESPSSLDNQQAFQDLPLVGEEDAAQAAPETDPSGTAAETAPQTDLPLLPDGPVEAAAPEEEAETEASPAPIQEEGSYTSREDVALYLYTYGRLPENFITKKQAQQLGWQGGGLDDYAYGKCIGGDRFGNYEGLLPEKKGRQYYECDIDTLHKSKRGAKRIIFSSDGLIYYTSDHYESFTLLYGEE